MCIRSLQDQKHPSSEKVPVEEENSPSFYPGKELMGRRSKRPQWVSGAETAVEVVDEARPLRALETFPGPALNIGD